MYWSMMYAWKLGVFGIAAGEIKSHNKGKSKNVDSVDNWSEVIVKHLYSATPRQLASICTPSLVACG